MTKEARKNAYLYCKLRDEQFALYDAYAKKQGLLMNTFLVVNVLFYARVYEKGGMTQAEICRRTFQSKQTVSLIIRHLLEENAITVTEASEDKRTKLVEMTELGYAKYETIVRHITWAEDTAMAQFTPEQQHQLVELSRIFTENLAQLIQQETEEAKHGTL